MLPPDKAITEVAQVVDGTSCCIVGGAVVAEQDHLVPLVPGGPTYGDVDVFAYSQESLISIVQLMLAKGWTLEEREDLKWYRWLNFGTNGWKTNSIRLHTLTDTPVNVIYKTVKKRPADSMEVVLGSFDFGGLARGYDMELGMQFRDMRSYWYPGEDPNDPKPLMPKRRARWIKGLFSDYIGLRQGYRYAKHTGYGHPLQLCRDDLITGYLKASEYNIGHRLAEKRLYGEIYAKHAEHIGDGDLLPLIEAYNLLGEDDALELIKEVLD